MHWAVVIHSLTWQLSNNFQSIFTLDPVFIILPPISLILLIMQIIYPIKLCLYVRQVFEIHQNNNYKILTIYQCTELYRGVAIASVIDNKLNGLYGLFLSVWSTIFI